MAGLIPEISFDELVPVENFFSSYVAELENLGASGVRPQAHDCATGAVQQHSTLQSLLADANEYQSMMQHAELNVDLGFPAPGTPSCHPNLAHFCCNPNPNLICLPSFPNPEDVDLIVALAMEEGGSHNYDAAPTKTFQAIAGVKESSTYPASQGQFSGTAPVQSHCTPQVSSLTAPEMDEADNVGDNEETSVGRPKRRRIRSEVQQEQNKAAQQRYRERKKQKATKLEHTVQDLNEQIKDLEKFKAENAGLQEKKTQLEAELLEKDAQIKRLNEDLEFSKQLSSGDQEEQSMHSAVNCPENVKKMWHSKMEELQNIFDVNDIKHARITGDGVPEEIMGMLGMVVEEVVGIVGRMIRIEGMNMFDLVTANVDRCDHVCDEQMRDVWVRVGKLVNLTPDQVSMMKVLRAEHLKKLEDIYNRRQKLNLEAISVLLPGGGGAGGAFGQVGNRFGGFLSRSKENDRTGKVLDSLKENLKEEQRLARELEYIVFNRLLNPIQGSWFLLEAYPCHCDCLALLNGCYEVYVGKD